MREGRPGGKGRLTAWGCIATGLLTACNGVVPVARPADGAKVAAGVYANVAIDAQGKRFQLRPLDGSPVGDVTLTAGQHAYRTQGGAFHLPASVLADVRDHGNGFFRVFAPGFLPTQVWIGQAGDDVPVVPLFATVTPVPMPVGGGRLASEDGAIALQLPAGLLAATTPVSLSGYAPPVTAADQAAYQAKKGALLARLAGGGYRLADACRALPDQVTQSLGILVSVGGPLSAGRLTLAYDMAPLLRGWDGDTPAPWLASPSGWSAADRSRASAAAALLANARALVACYGQGPVDAALAADGVSLEGTRLTFAVDLPADRALDGFVQSTVQSLYDLGVLVQVTVVNAVAPNLPASALPPDTIGLGTAALVAQNGQLTTATTLVAQGSGIISEGGSQVVSNNGAGIVSNHGGGVINGTGSGLISHNGGTVINGTGSGLVSNNGGSITGDLRVPFMPEEAKYALLSWTEWLWPSASIQASDVVGTFYGDPTSTDGAGAYTLASLPGTPNVLVIEARPGGYALRALAPAPGDRHLTVGINAATTGLASWVASEFRSGAASPADLDFSAAGYPSDITYLDDAWGVVEARNAVTGTLQQAADATATWFRVDGREPAMFKHWVSTFAGDGTRGYANGSFAAARFDTPTAMAFDAAGNLYVADNGNHCLRKIAPGGAVSLFAGQPTVSTPYADGPALTATFNNPQGMAFDPAGNMYVADYGNHCLRKIDPAGNVTTLAGSPGDPGTGPVDGTGSAARLNYPIGLVWHPSGVLYVTDRYNTLRRVTPAGVVTTVAGGVPGNADGAGTAARFDEPTGLAVAPNGDLLCADASNHTIRRITPAGVVTTVAGTGSVGGADGPALSAGFDTPYGLALAPDGTLYVAELTGNRLRAISPAGVVSTVAGGSAGFQDDLPRAARFNLVRDVAIDPAGRLFVTDRDNHAVRHVRP